MRQCISCKQQFLRETLIRILKESKTGNLILEPDKYKDGRSIYLCKNQECVNAFQANKRYKTKTEYQEIFKKIKI